ncbi:MAG TPA: PASTA domain-containing protein, partial [Blastocatellia bacterium]|nr:PASTA domain-containing protein [Blastocatellia bacterium]
EFLRQLLFPQGRQFLGLRPVTAMLLAVAYASLLGWGAYTFLKSPTPPIVETQQAQGTPSPQTSPSLARLYQTMSEQEQVEFIRTRLSQIARAMSTSSAEYPDEAVSLVKTWLDGYARRIGTGNTRLWAEDLNLLFKRARTQFVPTIIRAFKGNGVPPLIGVYLPMIETEYRNIATENYVGAAGLFSFTGAVAREYGLDPAERTNVEKMAGAAARYMNDRQAEFGTDARGIELAILGYNRSPKSVMRDLKQVTGEPDRTTFWTLAKNKAKLDQVFQRDSINYVPRFYAAAIIGETPWAFGLDMPQPLSTYTEAPAVEATPTPTVVAPTPTPTPGAIMPNVLGLSARDAQVRLARLKLSLKVREVPKEGSSAKDAGKVVSQMPAPGARLATGARVTLYVAQTSPNQVGTVVVPNLVGRSVEEAQKIVAGAGLKLIYDSKGYSPTAQFRLLVQRQSPAPGTKVKPGDNVTIYLDEKSNISKPVPRK